MKRLTKTFAAMMIVVAAFLAVGCTPEEEPDNGGDNNGGNNNEWNLDGNGTYQGHKYVDLGLPSGTLLATCNVGATTPEGYGDYFAWGDTLPKTVYNWSTYRMCNGDFDNLNKYCSIPRYGINDFTDTLTVLIPEDDAATHNWGSGWRMPTKAEWKELHDNTTYDWKEINGVRGVLIFSKVNGNTLFLPGAGNYADGEHHNTNAVYYRSSSLCTDYPCDAWNYVIMADQFYKEWRCWGYPVRAVRATR